MQEQMNKYKNQIYQEMSRMTKGLGSDKRLEILNILSQGPKTVDNIAKATGFSVANTSRHLQVLKESHLVVTNRNGNFIRYSLASEKVIQLVLLLLQVGEEQLAEVKRIETTYDQTAGVPQIELEEAQTLSKSKDVLLLDLRPTEEYDSGHLPRAINLPMDDFEQKKEKLPKEKTLIVYCRGRQCGYANLAAQTLQENGHSVYSLNRSFAEWKWMTR